jgi:YesN/AraC family two-component response regulator
VLVVVAIFIYKGHFVGKKKEETGTEKDKDEEEGKDKPPLELDFIRECAVKLEYRMEVEKAYRAPDISLRSLAEKVSIQPHLLSRILNEHLKCNFADYINSYRIEAFKKIIDSTRGAEENVTSVAHDVGFNSMTTFYKAFKKNTGMTPKQYKKKVFHAS